MKAITLWQFWATLVAIKKKRIETRSWYTRYRGPLAIHAAKTYPMWARELALQEPIAGALRDAGLVYGEYCNYPVELPTGCVIATCRLVACLRIESTLVTWYNILPWVSVEIPPGEPEHSFGDYTPGRYAWILADVEPLPEPVPCRGYQGLWEWNP